jgi:WD40 repeat protein
MLLLIVKTWFADRFPPRESLALAENNALVGLTPDGKTLVTKTVRDGHNPEPHGPIRLWDIRTGKERAAYLSEVTVYPTDESVGISPDGELLAVNCKDGLLRILEFETGGTLSAIPFIDEKETGLLIGGLTLFSPDSKRMAFLSRTGGTEFINLWDRQSKTTRVLFERRFRSPAAFSLDGRMLVTDRLNANTGDFADESRYSSQIELWELSSEKLRCSYSQEGWIQKAVFAPDGKLVIRTSKNEVRFLDQDTGKTLWVLSNIDSLNFYPDGHRLLAVSFSPSRIQCWDWKTEMMEFQYDPYSTPKIMMPDGRTLATRLSDGTVQFWDVPPVKPLWWVLTWTAIPAGFAILQLMALIRVVLPPRPPPATSPATRVA